MKTQLHQDVLELYQELGIQHVETVNTTLSCDEVNGYFSSFSAFDEISPNADTENNTNISVRRVMPI